MADDSSSHPNIIRDGDIKYLFDLAIVILAAFAADYLVAAHFFPPPPPPPPSWARLLHMYINAPMFLVSFLRNFLTVNTAGIAEEGRRSYRLRRLSRLYGLALRLAAAAGILSTVRATLRRAPAALVKVAGLAGQAAPSSAAGAPPSSSISMSDGGLILAGTDADAAGVASGAACAAEAAGDWGTHYGGRYSSSYPMLYGAVLRYLYTITWPEGAVALVVVYVVLLDRSIIGHWWSDWVVDRLPPLTRTTMVFSQIRHFLNRRRRRQPNQQQDQQRRHGPVDGSDCCPPPTERALLLGGRFGDDVADQIDHYTAELERTERLEGKMRRALTQDESYRFVDLWSASPHLVDPAVSFVELFFDPGLPRDMTKAMAGTGGGSHRHIWAHVWYTHPATLGLLSRFANDVLLDEGRTGIVYSHRNCSSPPHLPDCSCCHCCAGTDTTRPEQGIPTTTTTTEGKDLLLKTAVVMMQGAIYTLVRREVPHGVRFRAIHDSPEVGRAYLHQQTGDALHGLAAVLSLLATYVTRGGTGGDVLPAQTGDDDDVGTAGSGDGDPATAEAEAPPGGADSDQGQWAAVTAFRRQSADLLREIDAMLVDPRRRDDDNHLPMPDRIRFVRTVRDFLNETPALRRPLRDDVVLRWGYVGWCGTLDGSPGRADPASTSRLIEIVHGTPPHDSCYGVDTGWSLGRIF